MPNYLVESHLADRAGVVDDALSRARLAGELGSGIRYVRMTLVLGDELVLRVFEVPSLEALRRIRTLAELGHERIVEVAESEVRPRLLGRLAWSHSVATRPSLDRHLGGLQQPTTTEGGLPCANSSPLC